MITYQELAGTVKDVKSYEFALRVAQEQLQVAINAFNAAPSLAYRLIADKDRKEAAGTVDKLKLNYYELVKPDPDYSFVLNQ